MPGPSSDIIERFAQLWRDSKRPLFFTGAGISTDSGIPDFRGPSGFWKTNQPIYFQDYIASEEARRTAWERYLALREITARAEPNSGHLAIARLMAQRPAAGLITQNVDGLHQAAGLSDEGVVEIHGNATYCKCLDCGKRFELPPLLEAFAAEGTLPHCDGCGGIVKLATISFGQPMPEAETQRAEALALNCDLFVAVGSSLVVYPAAGLPMLAKEQGARLVILNREPTDMDAAADLVLHQGIGETFEALLGRLTN